MFGLRKYEAYLLIAALLGLVIGKLIKNFRWGMLIAILLVTCYAFLIPKRK